MGDVKALAALLATLVLTTAPGTGAARAAEGETWAFLYADKERSTSTYLPGQARGRADIVAWVTRSGTGGYTVRLTNAASAGVPVVTAVNGAGVHCQLTSFGRNGADELVRVGCYDRDVPADSEFTLSYFASTAPDSGAAGAYGYVHDDQPALATYADPATRYNSTGGRVEIHRGTGDPRTWTARFFGQAFSNNAGNVQVSAVGSRPARCGIVRWDPHPLGVDAQVRCDTPAGAAPYTPQWTLAYSHDRSVVGGTTGFFGYLQADQPTAPAYTPSVPRNRAPSGLTHTVRRDGEGRYEAQVYGPLKDSLDAHVSVNGDTDSYCVLAGWTITPGTQPAARVGIACHTANGDPADAWFSLSYYSP